MQVYFDVTEGMKKLIEEQDDERPYVIARAAGLRLLKHLKEVQS